MRQRKLLFGWQAIAGAQRSGTDLVAQQRRQTIRKSIRDQQFQVWRGGSFRLVAGNHRMNDYQVIIQILVMETNIFSGSIYPDDLTQHKFLYSDPL
jgi:hypothetical protein